MGRFSFFKYNRGAFSGVFYIYSNHDWIFIQGQIKGGGGTLAKCQGPRAFGGPADFLGLAVVYGPVFSGPHCTVLGEHIYVVGRWGTTF